MTTLPVYASFVHEGVAESYSGPTFGTIRPPNVIKKNLQGDQRGPFTVYSFRENPSRSQIEVLSLFTRLLYLFEALISLPFLLIEKEPTLEAIKGRLTAAWEGKILKKFFESTL